MSDGSGTYVADLDTSFPAGTDQVATADNAIRKTRTALVATFPNVDGAVTSTDSDLEHIAGQAATGKGLILGVETQNLSAASEAEFTGLAADSVYEFWINNLFGSTTQKILTVTPGNAGGYSSGSTVETINFVWDSSTGDQSGDALGAAWSCGYVVSSNPLSGKFTLFTGNATDNRTEALWEIIGATDSTWRRMAGGGAWTDESTKIKFYPASGTFTGQIVCKKVI